MNSLYHRVALYCPFVKTIMFLKIDMTASLDGACVIMTSRWRHDTSSDYLLCFGEVWLYNLIINSANLN